MSMSQVTTKAMWMFLVCAAAWGQADVRGLQNWSHSSQIKIFWKAVATFHLSILGELPLKV